MPSLHSAWAIWVACAVFPRVNSNVVRVLAVLYPIVTVYTVVATGNHYFLDAVGGLIVFVVAYVLARGIDVARRRRTISTHRPVPEPASPAAQHHGPLQGPFGLDGCTFRIGSARGPAAPPAQTVSLRYPTWRRP